MNNAWALKKGFTIIELLVAIVVIGILIGIVVVSYGTIQQRSRDAERESDITQIKIALEKYHAEKSMYPEVCDEDGTACNISLLSSELAPYLKVIPHDPRNAPDTFADYRYVRGDTSTDSYAIYASYESKAPCKTGNNVNVQWWGATVPTC